MENTKDNLYEVIVTGPAEESFYNILNYLYKHYNSEKAGEIAGELRDITETLNHQPGRGTYEPRLSHFGKSHRFILFKRTSRADIKVIYYIDDASKTVYVTDFFPTEMDDTQISERNR